MITFLAFTTGLFMGIVIALAALAISMYQQLSEFDETIRECNDFLECIYDGELIVKETEAK